MSPFNERMVHDHAWAGMHGFLDHMPEMTDEQRREMAAVFYNGCRALLESYCSQLQRLNSRLTPTKD